MRNTRTSTHRGRTAALLTITIMAAVVSTACVPGSPPPVLSNSPVSGTSVAGVFPGSTAQQQVTVITCVSDGAVVTAEVERIDDAPAFNTEWFLRVRDVNGVNPATATFPWIEEYAQGPASTTLVSDPIPGDRCVQIWVVAPSYFDLDSPRFTYTLSW